MTLETFKTLALTLGIGGLITFMAFIMWDLTKKSQAGRFGALILFGALGMGVLAFVIKTFFIELIEHR